MYIEIAGEHQDRPYWLIGTRRPTELAAAIEQITTAGPHRRNPRGMIMQTGFRKDRGWQLSRRSAALTGCSHGFLVVAGAYGARKVIQFVWKRITGKEPPSIRRTRTSR